MSLIEDSDLLKHSVTRDDPDVLNPGGHPQVLWLTFPNAAYLNAPTGVLPIDIPLPWSRARDRLLITTTLHETMWGAAIAKAIAKMITLGFTVEDRAKSERRTAMAQTRLLTANNGKGWTSFLWQHLSDYLLTDNGAFVELVYKSSDVRSQFLGFMHLDSLRVTRTGDPEIPVIYEDLRGRMHELKAHQVLTFVDMESGRAEARGTGLCAASRAYPTIHKIAGLERYVSEKITGTGKQKEIHIINGISGPQLQMALNKAEEDQANRGLVSYRGVALIPLSAMTAKPDGYRIPLSEVPDGFDPKAERDNTYLKYANCIGLPLTDIQPLSGQGLGTGKQSEIIDDAGSEFGLAAWGKAWEHASNERIMPTTTTFSWADKSDARKQAASADVSLKRAQTRAAQVASGEITPQQSLQLAADAGDVPDSFLQSDETPDDMLTDTEKPVSEGERDAMDANQPVPDQVPGTPPVTVPATTTATKARKLTIADLDDAQALKAAEALFDEVQR